METVGLSNWNFKTPATKYVAEWISKDPEMAAISAIVDQYDPEIAPQRIEEYVIEHCLNGSIAVGAKLDGPQLLLDALMGDVDWDDLYEALFDESVAAEHEFDGDYGEDGRRVV